MFKTVVGVSIIAAVSAHTFAGDFKPATVPAEFGRLVPTGAWAVVYSPSVNHIVQELMPLARSIDPQAAQGLMMAPMMMQMIATSGEAKDGRPAPPAQFNLDAPMGVAIGPANPETGEPNITVILSAKDAGKVRVSNMGSGPSTVVHLAGTDYLALTSSAFTPSAKPNALCDGMFEADLSINIDQAAVVKAFGHEIGQALEMMNMQMPLPAKATAEQKEQAQAMASMQANSLKQIHMLLDGFDVWNFGIDLDGTELDLLAQYTLTEGSIIPFVAGSSKEAMASLAKYVPADMPIQWVVNKATARTMTDADGQEDLYPAATQAKLMKLMPLFLESIKHMQTGVSGGIHLGSDGMQIAEFIDTRQSSVMIRDSSIAFTALGDAGLGITVKDLPMVMGDGAGFTMSMDLPTMMEAFGAGAMTSLDASGGASSVQMEQAMKAILGGDAIDIRMVGSDNMVGVAFGNDKKLVGQVRKAMRNPKGDSQLTAAIAHAWAKPTFAFSTDVSAVASTGLGLLKSMVGPMRVILPKTMPQSDPVPVDMIGSATGSASQVRVRTDVANWIKWFKKVQAMMSSAEAQAV
jgi:hypothetical protein